MWLFSEGRLTVGGFVIVASILPSLTGIIWNMGDVIVRAVRNYGNLKDAVRALQTPLEKLSEGEGSLGMGIPPSDSRI